MIKNIVFDLGGVLIQLDIPKCVNETKQLLGDNFVKLGLLSDGEGAGHELMNKFETGLVTEDYFLTQVLQWCKLETTKDDIRRAWNSMLLTIPDKYIEILKYLRHKGYNLYMLSNTNVIHWNHILGLYDLPSMFDRIILSFEEGYAKPNSEIFESLIKKTRVNAQETIYIDDLEANRNTGKAFGWKVYSSIEEIDFPDFF